MKHKVVNKQYNSSYCVICGDKNEFGMNGRFYELDNGEVVGIINTKDWHQSYPGRVHGGMIAAVIDELVARAMWATEPDAWGVTMDLSVKYRKPVPTDATLKAVGRIIKETHRSFVGEAEIILEDGTIAATGVGKYLKLHVGEIADDEYIDEQWYLLEGEEDPAEVELPE